MKAYPAGYARHGVIIEQLMADPKTLLIDIRFKPASNFRGWTAEELKAKYGKRYRMAGKFLGNLLFGQKGSIQLVNPSQGIAGLVQYLQEGYDLIVLCGCSEFSACHRRMVVDLLRGAMPDVEIVMPEQVQ